MWKKTHYEEKLLRLFVSYSDDKQSLALNHQTATESAFLHHLTMWCIQEHFQQYNLRIYM